MTNQRCKAPQVPHDWVTIFVSANDYNSKDSISQCARCNMLQHHYEHDGKAGNGYPDFWLRGMRAEDTGCSRGDMAEERAALEVESELRGDQDRQT